MLQGVLTSQRVRLLFSQGMKCFRERKPGERKRKSVRGCIVSSELSVLNLVITKKGEGEIAGVTDVVKPRRLGPKRANRIRALFNLEKKDDVRPYVIRRTITPKVKEAKDGEAAPKQKKPYNKAPKIQRLITPQRLQHRRERAAIKRVRYTKARKEAEDYNKLLAIRQKEQREVRQAKLAKKRSVSRSQSQTASQSAEKKAAAPKPVVAAKKEEPKAAPPKAAAPAKKEEPKAAAPTKAAPKKEEPKAAAPKSAAPAKVEAKATAAPPKQAAPKKEEPKAAAPKAAAPAKKEEPKAAAPKPEAKKDAPKKAEAPKAKPPAKK